MIWFVIPFGCTIPFIYCNFNIYIIPLVTSLLVSILMLSYLKVTLTVIIVKHKKSQIYLFMCKACADWSVKKKNPD